MQDGCGGKQRGRGLRSALALELKRPPLGGLPAGYASKLLGKDGTDGRKKKMWPVSLEAMLGVLGLKILMMEDAAAAAHAGASRAGRSFATALRKCVPDLREAVAAAFSARIAAAHGCSQTAGRRRQIRLVE